MIEVEIYSQGEVVWSAEAEDEEAACRAAQIGWDESWDPYFSKSRRVRFSVEGKTVATLERRP